MGARPFTLAPGQILAGKYEVVEILGQGGMGIVVAAVHRQFDQCFAIKILLSEYAAQPGAVSRFKREARAAGALRSTHAVRVYDVDTLEDGTPYIVMEFLDGNDLVAEAAQRGPIPVGELADWIIQVCSAIDEAHERGIVHRDLKPSNIFLVHEGEARIAKVIDFGISRSVNASAGHVYTDGSFGTLHYMSPELVRGASRIDGRSDVWSLGVVLYRMLAERYPHASRDAAGLAVAIATEPPAGLDIYRPDLPPELVAVVMRALARKPELRYSTAGSLAQALAPFGGGRRPLAARSTRIRVARPLETLRPAALSTDGEPIGAIASGVPDENTPPLAGVR